MEVIRQRQLAKFLRFYNQQKVKGLGWADNSWKHGHVMISSQDA
jgi:hypothetical protein